MLDIDNFANSKLKFLRENRESSEKEDWTVGVFQQGMYFPIPPVHLPSFSNRTLKLGNAT
jgi:hypothetical protein